MGLLSGSSPRSTSKRGGSRTSGGRELKPVTSGPWTEVLQIDGAPGVYAGGKLLYAMENMYVPEGANMPCVARPSLTRVGTIQLGSGSTRNGQCVFNHIRPDGTEDRLLFAGGKMYSWDGNVTATDITPSAVTISTTARIYCCTFADLLIVSDGVNRPWTYDPATTTAAYIDIDGSGTAWTAFGPPVSYSGKLFFIVRSVGSTTYSQRIAWSEEADPTSGYMQSAAGNTFTDFWTLSQTDANRLTCLIATNSALYYFRPDSIGAITGKTNADFATTATHDAIPSTVGTISPAAVLLVGDDIYFMDRSARPHCLRNGQIVELWRAFPHVAIEATLTGMEQHATATFVPELKLVLFDHTVGSAPSGVRRVFDHITHRYFGIWWFPTPSLRAIGTLRDTNGVPQTVMIGQQDFASTGGGTAAEGYVYRLRKLGESVATFDDSMTNGNTNFLPSLTTVVAGDLERDQIYTRVTAEVFNGTGASDPYSLQLDVNDGTSAIGEVATSNGVSQIYRSDRVSWGLNSHVRWLAVTIRANDVDTPNLRISRLVAQRIDAGFNPDGP